MDDREEVAHDCSLNGGRQPKIAEDNKEKDHARILSTKYHMNDALIICYQNSRVMTPRTMRPVSNLT